MLRASDATAGRLRGGARKSALEPCRGRGIYRDEVGMSHHVMRIVRKDNFLQGYTFSLEPPRETDGLAEAHVAVVVTVNQQHRRAPRLHRRDGRGRPGDVEGVLKIRLLFVPRREQTRRTLRGQIVHTVNVHAAREEIGVTSQRECWEKTAVRAAVDSKA